MHKTTNLLLTVLILGLYLSDNSRNMTCDGYNACTAWCIQRKDSTLIYEDVLQTIADKFDTHRTL